MTCGAVRPGDQHARPCVAKEGPADHEDHFTFDGYWWPNEEYRPKRARTKLTKQDLNRMAVETSRRM